jgi:hypothetical protein
MILCVCRFFMSTAATATTGQAQARHIYADCRQCIWSKVKGVAVPRRPINMAEHTRPFAATPPQPASQAAYLSLYRHHNDQSILTLLTSFLQEEEKNAAVMVLYVEMISFDARASSKSPPTSKIEKNLEFFMSLNPSF